MSLTYGPRNMKIVLTATLIVALSILSLFAIPIMSTAASATVTVPTSATAGATISVTGTNFQTSSSLEVYFNGQPVAATTTTSVGAFSTTFTISASTATGIYTVEAESCCTGGTVVASTSISVTAVVSKAKLVLRPFSIVSGKSDKVTGTKFSDSTSVSVTFNGAVVITTTTNSTGGFVSSFTVPSSTPSGSYTVTATDGNGVTASNTLTVTSAASKLTMKVTATAHRDGATVTVSGNNFLASHKITVTFNGNTVATATSNSTGGFTGSFLIADTPAGSSSIVATDGTNSVTKAFVVNAYIVVTPTSGAPGAALTVNGTGFAAGAMVTLTLGTTSVGTATTNSVGSFQVSITIPSVTSGGETMTATDTLGNSATAHVRVT